MKHKNLKTIVIISLNVLFCILVIWFFTQNSILRPYAGSFLKEAISAMLLLGSLYANCNSADIIAGTKYSLSTVERCLSELRKQGLIEHTGSKKCGGYCRVH
jgi:hypothetical protein